MLPVHKLHLATVTSISFISLISLKWRWRSQTRAQGKHCSPQPTSGPQEKVPQGSSTSDLHSKTMALKTPGPSTGAQGCGCVLGTLLWLGTLIPHVGGWYRHCLLLSQVVSYAACKELGHACFLVEKCSFLSRSLGQWLSLQKCHHWWRAVKDSQALWQLWLLRVFQFLSLMRSAPYFTQLCNFCTPLWWLCNGQGGYLLSFPFLTAASWSRHTSDSSKADNNRTTSKSLS